MKIDDIKQILTSGGYILDCRDVGRGIFVFTDYLQLGKSDADSDLFVGAISICTLGNIEKELNLVNVDGQGIYITKETYEREKKHD